MTRTYGSYQYVEEPTEHGRRLPASWVLRLEPAAAIRAKRVFGRVQQGKTGELFISHTTEVARDIQWFSERWALTSDEASRVMLEVSADEHRGQEILVGEILSRPPRLDLPEVSLKEPREYQLVALALLRARFRYLLTDSVGLGKTLTGALNFMYEEARPALVVPPTHLTRRWVTELNESMPWLTVEVAKKTTPPIAIIAGDLPDVIIVPYSKLSGWRDALAGRVRSVVFDEVQELRNGTDTKKGSAAYQIASQATYVLGLTATPIYNYGGEIWSIMNILAPGELGTAAEFSREWGAYSNTGHVHVGDPAALGSYLREKGLMLGRTRADVGRELPKVIKVPEVIEADTAALDAIAGDAAAMARLILSNTSTRQDRFKAAGELDWKMREATGIAKAPYVAAYVRMLLESEEKVTLFGWHRAVYDIWNDLLADFNPVMYTGSETDPQKARAEETFKGNDCRVLIMSLRSGAGVDGLQTVCNVAVFGELDWSPQVHEQAIGRFARDGMDESRPVVAYYLNSAEGSDPAIMETLQVKRNQAEPIVSKDGKLLDNAVHDTSRARRLAEQVLARHGDAPVTTVTAIPATDIWAAPEALWTDESDGGVA